MTVPLCPEKYFKILAEPVGQPRPQKMKQLVRENQPKQRLIAQQVAFQHDAMATDITGGVNRDATLRLFRQKPATERRQLRPG
jgi:hypothetical protein